MLPMGWARMARYRVQEDRTLAGCFQGIHREMKDVSQESGPCEGFRAKGVCREDDVIKHSELWRSSRARGQEPRYTQR